MLPLMLKAADRVGDLSLALRLFPSPTLSPADYLPYTETREGLEIDRSYSGVRAAMIASGTATLEAALWGIPAVVTYRVHPLTALFMKRMIRVEHASIVNILAGKTIYPEFIQGDAEPGAMAAEMRALITSEERIEMDEQPSEQGKVVQR